MTIEQHSVPSLQDQYDVYIALYCVENASFQNFIEKLRVWFSGARDTHLSLGFWLSQLGSLYTGHCRWWWRSLWLLWESLKIIIYSLYPQVIADIWLLEEITWSSACTKNTTWRGLCPGGGGLWRGGEGTPAGRTFFGQTEILAQQSETEVGESVFPFSSVRYAPPWTLGLPDIRVFRVYHDVLSLKSPCQKSVTTNRKTFLFYITTDKPAVVNILI